jgi:formylglycine-generating enzyme required for sulfatase activity
MIKIPAGEFRPFVISEAQNRKVKVPSFFLDIHAVTNGEFLQFVKANPQWKRSRVPGVFADSNYLKQWAGDLEIGDERIINSPVTHVSWFAANAYCKWKGKRLPTMDEWELAASAAPANAKPGEKLTRMILEWYDHPNPSRLPAVKTTYKNQFGIYDMHGLIWEWVEDFNGVMLGGGTQGRAGSALFCGAASAGTANREDYAAYMRYAFRQSLQAGYTVGSLGFRCAQDVQSN